MDKKKFLETEKVFLLSLIEEVKGIIENPRTDGPSICMKNEAWDVIHQQYSTHAAENGYTERTKEQLKNLWKNLKARTRQADSELKQHLLKTGGGPAYKNNSDEPLLDQVRSIVPTLDATINNPWDTTSRYEEITEDDIMGDDVEYKNSNKGNPCTSSQHSSIKQNKRVFKTLSNLIQSANSVQNCQDTSAFYRSDKIAKRCESSSTAIEISDEEIDERDNERRITEINSPFHELKKKMVKLQSSSRVHQHNIPSESVLEESLNKSAGNSHFKRAKTNTFKDELELRVQKLTDAIDQQKELHLEKMSVVLTEKEYWDRMLDVASIKKNIKEAELDIAKCKLRYWESKQSHMDLDTSL